MSEKKIKKLEEKIEELERNVTSNHTALVKVVSGFFGITWMVMGSFFLIVSIPYGIYVFPLLAPVTIVIGVLFLIYSSKGKMKGKWNKTSYFVGEGKGYCKVHKTKMAIQHFHDKESMYYCHQCNLYFDMED